jgi:hypothetical protein
VLDTVEASVGKVQDFQLWRDSVNEAIDKFIKDRDDCLKIQNTGDRILCQTGNLRSFLTVVESLRKDLDELTGGSVEIGQDFVKGIRNCLGRT